MKRSNHDQPPPSSQPRSSRPPQPPPHPLVGPRKEGESVEDFYARYNKYNNELAEKYAEPKTGDQLVREQPDIGSYSIQCSVCGVRSEPASRIYEATRIAQGAGYTQLKNPETGKAMRDETKRLVWLCKDHSQTKKTLEGP